MKISIAIPAYKYNDNCNIFLDELLKSIHEQDYDDYEVVISDHTKGNDYQEIVNKYKGLFDLIYFKNTSKYGNISHNTNSAIKKCSGDVIKVMHQDDKFYSNKALSKICESIINNPEKKWGALGFIHYYKQENQIRRPMIPSLESTIGNPSVSFFLRNKNGLDLYDENIFYYLDKDFHTELQHKYGAPIIIEDMCILIGMHDSNSQYSLQGKSQEDLKKMESKREFIKLQNKKIQDLQNENVNLTSTFNHDGKIYGRSPFNPEWIKIVSSEPRVILDVGCYDGGDSIRFKQSYPNSMVFSFEASKERHAELELIANRYGFNLVKKAVLDYNGECEFYDSKVDGERVDAQGSVFKHTENYKSKYPRIKQNESSYKIICTTLDSFCEENGITEIDFAQIDVEGAELNVVKGFGKILPKMVFLETLGEKMFVGGTKKNEIHDLLVSMGYKMIKDLGSDRVYIIQ